jgi:hypothetical protein
VHLNVYLSGGARGCALTPAGLNAGHNVHNLAVLEALARAKEAVAAGVAADASGPRRSGTGLPGDELRIDALPFVDFRDTRREGVARIASYPGCGSTTNEAGREVLYRLELAQPTNVRAFVISLGAADIDLHVLSSPSGEGCVSRNDRVVTRQLAAGTWWLSLDTFQAAAGEYLLVVMAD